MQTEDRNCIDLSELKRLEAIALLPPVAWERMKIEGIELISTDKTLYVKSDAPGLLHFLDRIGAYYALLSLNELNYFDTVQFWAAGKLEGGVDCVVMPWMLRYLGSGGAT